MMIRSHPGNAAGAASKFLSSHNAPSRQVTVTPPSWNSLLMQQAHLPKPQRRSSPVQALQSGMAGYGLPELSEHSAESPSHFFMGSLALPPESLHAVVEGDALAASFPPGSAIAGRPAASSFCSYDSGTGLDHEPPPSSLGGTAGWFERRRPSVASQLPSIDGDSDDDGLHFAFDANHNSPSRPAPQDRWHAQSPRRKQDDAAHRQFTPPALYSTDWISRHSNDEGATQRQSVAGGGAAEDTFIMRRRASLPLMNVYPDDFATVSRPAEFAPNHIRRESAPVRVLPADESRSSFSEANAFVDPAFGGGLQHQVVRKSGSGVNLTYAWTPNEGLSPLPRDSPDLFGGRPSSELGIRTFQDSMVALTSPGEHIGERRPSLSLKKPKGPKEKHPLHKTELCRSWEETGMCRYGAKCQFAHSDEELRSVQRHPKWRTKPCKTFWTEGTCPYGKRCGFIHMSAELSVTLIANEPPTPQATSGHYAKVNHATMPMSPAYGLAGHELPFRGSTEASPAVLLQSPSSSRADPVSPVGWRRASQGAPAYSDSSELNWQDCDDMLSRLTLSGGGCRSWADRPESPVQHFRTSTSRQSLSSRSPWPVRRNTGALAS
ncbi:hypothetical protein HK405_010983 [Cladochytrium tenue]|nr:hypothetical protein HK405_010983 [Cladochytrium tenue]